MSASINQRWQGLPLTWSSLLVQPPRPPRIVYLDLLHWINMAKSDRDQAVPSGYSELLDASRRASLEGAVSFVLSDTILMEMAKIRNPDQRHAVGSLMEELTGYSMLLNHATVSFLELIEALEGIAPDGPNLLSEALPIPLVAMNVTHAMGVKAAIRITNAEGLDSTTGAIREHGLPWFEDLQSTSAEMLNRGLLLGPTDREAAELRIHGYRPEELGAVTRQRLAQERWLSDHLVYDGKDWRRGRLRDIISARELMIELGDHTNQWLTSRDLTIGDIFDGEDDLRMFVCSIPTVRVAVAIKCEYHRNANHKWTENDIYDIDMASLVLPYCDALFTDKELRSSILRSKVHESFGTFLPRHPEDLASWL